MTYQVDNAGSNPDGIKMIKVFRHPVCATSAISGNYGGNTLFQVVLGGRHACLGQSVLTMRMHVNEARRNIEAGSIDHFRFTGINSANRLDDPVSDPYIGHKRCISTAVINGAPANY
jgi:hypothetical protein